MAFVRKTATGTYQQYNAIFKSTYLMPVNIFNTLTCRSGCLSVGSFKAIRFLSSGQADRQHESNHGRNGEQDTSNGFRQKQALLGVGAVSLGMLFAGGAYIKHSWLSNEGQKSDRLVNSPLAVGKVFAAESTHTPGQLKAGLPTYSLKDVAAHDSKEKGIWVIYKNGVYDITEYVNQHPGGKKILMAAGKSMEPFWNIYSVHKNDEVYEIMEGFRVGNITEVIKDDTMSDANDPYKNEPQRSPLLIPSSKKPFNAEPPNQMLTDNFITPNHLFFVRNHLPVPTVDVKTHTLDVKVGKKPVSLTVNDLKTKFKKKSVTAITQCAGNRRSEMVEIKPVKGLNWGSAAISNAQWSGVSLNDLLQAQGVCLDQVKSKHIVFEGLDKQPDNNPYGASIPIDLAIMLKDDIIIAYEMNGEPIPRDHGFPLRVIIPGVVGARQVKWLSNIYFSEEESTSHWQRRDYKGFNSSIDWHNVDFDKAESISQLPVISAICEPSNGTELEEGAEEVTVKGYAWSGGGRGIIRVDVSADGGKTWHEATLSPNGQSKYKSWAWTLWEADIPLPPGATDTTLVVKAVDVSYNVQPDSVEGIWNLRGVLSNAWHRVKVTIPQ